VFPPPLVPGGGTYSLAGEGVGGFQLGRGDSNCGTLGIYVLCEAVCKNVYVGLRRVVISVRRLCVNLSPG